MKVFSQSSKMSYIGLHMLCEWLYANGKSTIIRLKLTYTQSISLGKIFFFLWGKVRMCDVFHALCVNEEIHPSQVLVTVVTKASKNPELYNCGHKQKVFISGVYEKQQFMQRFT